MIDGFLSRLFVGDSKFLAGNPGTDQHSNNNLKKKIKAILKSLDTLNPLGLVSESPELEINIITNSFPTAQN